MRGTKKIIWRVRRGKRVLGEHAHQEMRAPTVGRQPSTLFKDSVCRRREYALLLRQAIHLDAVSALAATRLGFGLRFHPQTEYGVEKGPLWDISHRAPLYPALSTDKPTAGLRRASAQYSRRLSDLDPSMRPQAAAFGPRRGLPSGATETVRCVC